MISRGRTMVAPAFLFACLVLGGSAQGIWQNAMLQLAGLGIIAWAALDRPEAPLANSARQLLLIGIAAIGVVLLQLVPLPASVWSGLGPRAEIAEGYSALGLPVPSEPLSLVPAATLDSLLWLIPPLAMFCAMVRLKAYRPVWLAMALVTATLISIALGALQVASSGGGELSHWYLYPETSLGRAVGFFANADHLATLLLVTIPFLVATIAAARSASAQRYSAAVAVALGLGVVIVVGLALNGSLAGYGLAVPVLAASLLIVIPAQSRLRIWLLGATALLVIGAVTALETTSIGAGKIGEHATSSVQSRAEILATTSRAIGEFVPFGSGLGSFDRVYPLYEQPTQVNRTYVVHAHNDYAEIILELGIAGLLLILAFLAWWGLAVWRVWRTAESGPFARAGAIASAAMLVHSLADFPLRTAAIAVCFAMSLALLADGRAAAPKEVRELRKRRHREFR